MCLNLLIIAPSGNLFLFSITAFDDNCSVSISVLQWNKDIFLFVTTCLSPKVFFHLLPGVR